MTPAYEEGEKMTGVVVNGSGWRRLEGILTYETMLETASLTTARVIKIFYADSLTCNKR